MTGHDLKNLKDLAVPEPREAAKRAALDAALTAFDEANTKSALPASAPLGVSEAPMQNPSQGNVTPLRQTGTSTLRRSFRMVFVSRSSQAIAASVAALVVAAPFAFQQLHQLGLPPPVTVIANAPAPSEKPLAATVTPQPSPNVSGARRNEGAAGGDGSTLAMSEKLKAADARPQSETQKEQQLKLALGENKKPETPAQTSQPAPAAADTQVRERSVLIDRSAAGKTAKAAPAAPPPVQHLGGPDAISGYTAGQQYRGDVAMASLAKRKADLNAEPAKQPAPAWMGRVDDQHSIGLEENRDKFEAKEINPVKQVATEPVSTFSIDVDTASYSFVRRALNAGHLPPKDAVRVEEMINYFPYAYPAPETAETPFKPAVTVMPSPWNPNNKLVHIAIKGYDLKSAERPRANVVLLMDVSGSMTPDDRLPLVKNAFRLLVDQLKPDDTVGIVTYASGSGIALEPTKVAEKAGAEGIADAYRLAESGFDKAAVNRIILATDGDFNVGITDQSELKSYIERKRQSGIFLSILGVGQGNHNDALMQTLAQNGNGTAAYVDTLNEARKVLVDESSSTLFTIAKDVKIQIEWNPERVAEYRLIGYETRSLKREDFSNDKVDAGDIGSGHTVTAIYEVTPVGAPVMADALRYGKKVAVTAPVVREPAISPVTANELGFLKLRYKRPNEDVSQLVTVPVTDELAKSNLSEVPAEQRFSIAVAAFGQLMKGEPYTQGYTFDDVLALAQSARGDDPFGYRAEFLNLVRLAKSAQP